MKDYRQLLRKANMIESKNKLQTLEILQQLISTAPKDLDNEDGRNLKDIAILNLRIEYLLSLKENNPTFSLSSTPAISKQIVLENNLLADAKSMGEELIDEDIPIEIDKIVPPIVEDIFTMLLDSEPIDYQDYLSFYKAVNGFLTAIPKPILYQKSEIAYYVGDTHGSYSETIIMVKYFEQILQKFPDVKIIFLGDYVDRNPFDLENLTLIIAFWIKYKKNVSLIRGNHEDPKINEAYGFINNLKENFVIEQWVEDLYAEILKIFVNLPIIHILDIISNHGELLRKVFSVHGGIPINDQNPEIPIAMKDLESAIKIPVNSYEQFDNNLNWLLWADPKENLDGFILDPNTGRNQFGLDMFEKFIQANHIDLVVRAHEVLKNGYKSFFTGKLISLFSTSYYKNRKIGDGAFLRIYQDREADPLPINPSYLEQDLNQF